MDTIFATSLNHVISQDRFSKGKQTIPWLNYQEYKLDLEIFKAFTQNKILWCTLSTFMTLPISVRNDPKRAFKILSKTKTGFTATPVNLNFNLGTQSNGNVTVDCPLCPENFSTYSFQDLHNNIDTLNERHVLIGGPEAYREFMGKCKNIVHTTIKAKFHGQNQYLKVDIIPYRKYAQYIYQGPHMGVCVYSRSRAEVKRIQQEAGLAE
jgi:dihydrofolate reductase